MSGNEDFVGVPASASQPGWRGVVARGLFPLTLVGGVGLALGLMQRGVAPNAVPKVTVQEVAAAV